MCIWCRANYQNQYLTTVEILNQFIYTMKSILWILHHLFIFQTIKVNFCRQNHKEYYIKKYIRLWLITLSYHIYLINLRI